MCIFTHIIAYTCRSEESFKDTECSQSLVFKSVNTAGTDGRRLDFAWLAGIKTTPEACVLACNINIATDCDTNVLPKPHVINLD